MAAELNRISSTKNDKGGKYCNLYELGYRTNNWYLSKRNLRSFYADLSP